MLASLEEVPGVLESRVDWTGRRFLLKIAPRAQVEAVVSRADAALGGGARRLDPRAEARAAGSFLRGEETWMRAGETLRLSRTEARVLAERYGREAAGSAALDEQRTRRLVDVMEREIAAAFERIHAEGQGLPADFGATFSEVLTRTLEKSRDFLDSEQLRMVKEYCESQSGR